MERINREMNGQLTLAIRIFRDQYPKRFLHQLVSGQLDMDRLDYLRRDSFYTGVSEGNIGPARIIKMLDVKDDRLVVEAKGIYSIENFLTARRLMYWQVYLHKTSVACEQLLVNTLKRARQLAAAGDTHLFASPALRFFLCNDVDAARFRNDPDAPEHFLLLDDNDIWTALKAWMHHPDRVLALLADGMVNRRLYKVEVSPTPFPEERQAQLRARIAQALDIPPADACYFLSTPDIESNMYNPTDDSIDILFSDGTTRGIAEASDMFDIALLSRTVKKHFLCYWRLPL